MAKQLKSPRSEAALAGLRRSHLQRRNQSTESVQRAIKKLQEAGSPVTLGRIAKATRELSAEGDGISESTILRNPECRQLYEDAAQPVRRRRPVKRALAQGDTPEPTVAEVRRLHYLLRLTKAELGAQVIKLERELARSEQANSLLREKILHQALGPLIGG